MRAALALAALSLCACGTSLPAVQHAEQVTMDAGVELCLLAHGVNVSVNAKDLPKMMVTKDKIDGVCDTALAAMDAAASADLPGLVDKLRAELRGLLQ